MNSENEAIAVLKNLTLGDLVELVGGVQKNTVSVPHCTKEELLSSKQYLDKDDIIQMLDCGESRAYSIIQSVKAYSDSLGITGKVLVSDYLAWSNRPR